MGGDPASGLPAPGEAALGGGATAEAALGTRREVLAIGAALASSAAAALVRAPAAAAQSSDVEQLERLLVLEQRLASLYEAALARDAIDPMLGRTLLDHEREHVRGLEQTLRARGRRSPRATAPPPRLGAALASRQAFARFAIDLESDTVRTYQEVFAALRNTRLLLPLGSIMTSGAQHVVALRQAAGEDLLARP
jgi:rubrerythrin